MKNCKTCKFYFIRPGATAGTCRYNAPEPQFDGTRKVFWPLVEPEYHDGCGKHESKPDASQ